MTVTSSIICRLYIYSILSGHIPGRRGRLTWSNRKKKQLDCSPLIQPHLFIFSQQATAGAKERESDEDLLTLSAGELLIADLLAVVGREDGRVGPANNNIYYLSSQTTIAELGPNHS